MARRIAWTDAAWRDLEHIADYIAGDSPGYAAAFVRRVRDQAGSLDEMAERGRVVSEVDEPAVRELVVGSYRLIYEVHEESVAVKRHRSVRFEWTKGHDGTEGNEHAHRLASQARRPGSSPLRAASSVSRSQASAVRFVK